MSTRISEWLPQIAHFNIFLHAHKNANEPAGVLPLWQNSGSSCVKRYGRCNWILTARAPANLTTQAWLRPTKPPNIEMLEDKIDARHYCRSQWLSFSNCMLTLACAYHSVNDQSNKKKLCCLFVLLQVQREVN
jgi:hypothetical protein